MLTVRSPAAQVRSPGVRIAVSSTVVRLALIHVVETTGGHTCDHDGPCSCLTVSDARVPGRPWTVLVVRDAPAPCQDALDAVLAGEACAVVLWDDPEALTAVFEAVHRHAIVIPNRVIELATQAPRLSTRQHETVRLLATGRSNQAIAAATRQSVSTTKRDIAELLAIFDAPNRAALISAATGLGFVSTPNGTRGVCRTSSSSG